MINFYKLSKFTIGFSIFLIILGLIFSYIYGFKVSVEYTGGTNIEILVPPTNASLTSELDEFWNSKGDLVKSKDLFQDRYLVKLSYLGSEETFKIKSELEEKFSDITIQNFETIDPSFGFQFVRNSALAVVLSLVAMVLYISYSFRNTQGHGSGWYYGVSAVVALIHDILFVLATFSILGYFFGVEIDGLFLTAILTIVGFSVNDTIVVFDRIRENLKELSNKRSFIEICNLSIFETINRSVITSFTVVFIMLSLFLLGGESIRYFSLAIVVGVISGTYSSIFIATPLVIWLQKFNRK